MQTTSRYEGKNVDRGEHSEINIQSCPFRNALQSEIAPRIYHGTMSCQKYRSGSRVADFKVDVQEPTRTRTKVLPYVSLT